MRTPLAAVIAFPSRMVVGLDETDGLIPGRSQAYPNPTRSIEPHTDAEAASHTSQIDSHRSFRQIARVLIDDLGVGERE